MNEQQKRLPADLRLAPVNAGAWGQSAAEDEPPSRGAGLALVVALHLAIGYALVSGLARQAYEVVKKPLQATIVQEVKVPEPPPPPPPPPPPKEIKPPKPVDLMPKAPPPPFVPPPEVAPPAQAPSVITEVAKEPPAAPPPIAPPAPLAPPAPVAEVPAPPPAPRKLEMSAACPNQVRPVVPPRAIADGVSGVVRAQVRIKGGKVQEVTILSGPKVFHDAVRKAMLQYACADQGETEVTAVQELRFEVE